MQKCDICGEGELTEASEEGDYGLSYYSICNVCGSEQASPEQTRKNVACRTPLGFKLLGLRHKALLKGILDIDEVNIMVKEARNG